jgi:hypothetical protein
VISATLAEVIHATRHSLGRIGAFVIRYVFGPSRDGADKPVFQQNRAAIMQVTPSRCRDKAT